MEFLSLGKRSSRIRFGSDIVLAEEWAVIAGVQPIDLKDDSVPLPEGIEGQTRKVLSNLALLLETAELRKTDVVRVHVALVDLPRLYDRMNLSYLGFFPTERLPTRSCIGVSALARGALVEMDFLVRRAAH